MDNFNTDTGSIRYYLKEPNSNQETLIKGTYLFKNMQSAFSTGIKVPPQYWNKQERLITSGKLKKEQNAKLGKFKLSIIQTHQNFNDNYHRIPTKDELKSIIKQAIEGSETKAIKKGKKTFEDVYNEVIEIHELKNKNAIEAIKVGANVKPTHKSYISSIKVAYKDLKVFATENNMILDIDTFNEKTCLEFQNWLINKRELAISTIATRIKRTSLILKRAFEKGYTNNRSYLLDEFKVKVPPTISTSLTEEDILFLYNYDFSQNERLERVRDLFVLACNTGLRFETVSRLQLEHIDTVNKIVRILTSKGTKTQTYKYANFNFFGFTEEILIKYNYHISAIAISNQKTNEYLKEIFTEIPEFRDREIKIEVPSEKGVKFKSYKFLDLIDFHTSRRSFCTNRYCEGWDMLEIWDYTGHTDEFTFKSYFRPTPEHERIRKNNIRKRSEQIREIDFKDKKIESLEKQMQQFLDLYNNGELEKAGKIIQMNQNAS